MDHEWSYAQQDPSEELARHHYFSIKTPGTDGPIEFLITVKEYVETPGDRSMRFVARADKQTNQRSAPFTPSGWGNTLSKALADCVRAVHRFPYEGEDSA